VREEQSDRASVKSMGAGEERGRERLEGRGGIIYL